tara:strand:- start:76 stop:267 length:192 start_codon:yes stop_codon:yes gene_type:complete
LGANLLAPFFFTNFKIMEKEEENKNKTPYRMSRIAFPKAKYGVFLAAVLILLVLIILYKDSIL